MPVKDLPPFAALDQLSAAQVDQVEAWLSRLESHFATGYRSAKSRARRRENDGSAAAAVYYRHARSAIRYAISQLRDSVTVQRRERGVS